jgi:uncharacterized protein
VRLPARPREDEGPKLRSEPPSDTAKPIDTIILPGYSSPSMFGVRLRDLERAGSVQIQRAVPADDPLWADLDLTLGGPAEVDLVATLTPTGQVLVTGRITAPLLYECRRCLARVDRTLTQDVALVWAPSEQLLDESETEGDIRALPPSAGEIELGEAIREELILSAPLYVVCKEECRGLCPRCGANLNEGPCGCAADEPDPRWDALRALKNE